MGCDIHLHVEVRPRKWKDDKWFHAAIYGEFSDRIYGMFYALADVRGDYEGITPHEPKGLPENITGLTRRELVLFVDDEFQDEQGYCSKEDAEKWVKEGYSKWYDNEKRMIIAPDWHSFSWCTADEIEIAINEVFKDKNGKWMGEPVEWYALLKYMRAYEEMDYDVRAVFWFDN